MESIRKSFRSLRKRYTSEQRAYTVVNDFENKTEKECIKLDEENASIYSDLLSKAKKARKSIKNSGLQMNLEVPPPPMPNNRERYILWKKRNISEKVIPQSDAVYFLTKEGYELNKDYEAYQAINLAEQVMKEKGIKKTNVDISKDFSQVYTSQDKNILRRFSMYGMNEFNASREQLIQQTSSSTDEESFHFSNRTLSMPNIYHRQQSAPSDFLRDRSNSLKNSPTPLRRSVTLQSNGMSDEAIVYSNQPLQNRCNSPTPSAPYKEMDEKNVSLYPKLNN